MIANFIMFQSIKKKRHCAAKHSRLDRIDGRYYFGSPQFERTDIHLDNGKTFTVLAKHASAENIYIQSARLNGRRLDHPYITFDDIQAGGVLEFEMANNPK